MLASAPRLKSADWLMKTYVLRQRKGSSRKQHLLSWAWQQGRGQVVEILQSEKQTERYQDSHLLIIIVVKDSYHNEANIYDISNFKSLRTAYPSTQGVGQNCLN